MHFSLFISAFFLFYLPAQAQYFYNDMVVTNQNKEHFGILVNNKVKKVTVKAFQNDGEEIDDFILRQEIDLKEATLTTYSKTTFSDASILKTGFNSSRQPVLVLDSAEGASTTTRYRYDEAGRITEMESLSVQAEQRENVVTETRRYFYNSKGLPEKMYRVKGGTDTMKVIFTMAENGLPGEEAWYKGDEKIETWYYYYDNNNRLTDIVRYNSAAKKMLPDYLFGYDEQGNISSKVTVQPGTGQFRIWQYKYNKEGLIIEETVLNKKRQPEGWLVYRYE